MFFCHKQGHTARKCRKKAKQHGRAPVTTNKLKDSVEEEGQESNEIYMEDDNGLYNMYTLEGHKAEPIMIGKLIDGISLEMELDTGASISVISEDTYQKLKNRGLKKKFAQTNPRLRTFTGELITPTRKLSVRVSNNGYIQKIFHYWLPLGKVPL